MTSDSLFFKCTEDTVHLHTKYSSKPTYYYYYTHRGLFTMTLLLGASPTLDLGSFITKDTYWSCGVKQIYRGVPWR